MVKRSFKLVFSLVFFVFVIIFFLQIVSANLYLGDVYFTVSDTVYATGEQINLKGSVYLANYTNNGTLVSSSSSFAGALVNLTITNTNGSFASNYTFTTDSNGTFYSRSNYYANGTEVNTSSMAGYYTIRAEYLDSNSTAWFSEVEISVVNKTIDYPLGLTPQLAATTLRI